MTNRKQRVVLNGQCSSWVDIRAGVPQGSILGPLLFLIYVNDLPNGLKSECKLFADDTSLFSVAHDLNTSASDVNNDLKLISDWAFQWKMSFNPDPSNQAQEIIFSRKKMKSSHPSVYFNNIPVNSTSVHKYLGMLLDDKFSYEHHLKFVLNKINKTIGLLRKFQQILPRQSLITIYKSFIRPHLDYGDIVYDRAFNESFHKNLESIQYNAAIAITGAIRGTSSEKLFQELGLEPLQSRLWLRKLCLFHKIFHEKSPSYLIQLIPPNNNVYATSSSQSNKIPSFKTRHNFFKDSFFPAVTSEWNSLDVNIRNSSPINMFKKELLKFITPVPNSTYNINDSKGLTLLTRLRLGLIHLGDHKFRRNFQDCESPMCSCGQDTETSTHFLLHCPNHRCARKTLFHKINKVSGNILRQSDSTITKILLFGNIKLDFETNKILLMFTIEFISLTERFSCPLFK